jgi:hypothetical protein
MSAASSEPAGSATALHVVVAVVVGGLVASGALLRVSAFRPTGLLEVETYARVFSVHAALVLGTAFAALVTFAPRRCTSGALPAILVGAQAVASLVVVLGAESRPAVLGGVAASLVATALFVLLVLDARSPSGPPFVVAAVAQAAAWAAALLGTSAPAGALLYPLVAATLAAPLLIARPRGERATSRALVGAAFVGYLLARTLVRFAGVSALVVVEVAAGLVLAALLLRSAAVETTAWLRAVRHVEAATFVQAVLANALFGSVADSHLADTVFPIGAAHLEALVLLVAFLRGLAPRPRALPVAWIGLALGTIGAYVLGWGMIVLGSRGMPRRYAQYLELFQVPHVVASLGAVALALGAVVLSGVHLSARAERRAQALSTRLR